MKTKNIEIIKTNTFVDKSKWGDGPWKTEPDKVHFVDNDTDMDCLIVRGPHGGLCGYVGVPESHPAFGKEYDSVNVEAHGGLMFASRCHEGHEGEGVCHVPRVGHSDAIWWFGFDCAHCGDFRPAYENPHRQSDQSVYRTLAYVIEECRGLARQLSIYEN